MTTPENAKINFNVDTVERERTFEPYVVSIGDRSVVMTDPADLDWQILANIERPTEFFRHVIADDDKKTFSDAKIPGWKLNLLITDYLKHYGLDTAGNARASLL